MRSESDIAEYLVSTGTVSTDKVDECLAIRVEMSKMGLKPKGLLEILVEKKYLTRAQADSARQEPAESGGPREIPGYEILGTIGKGAMGTVYKGYQKSMEREVAIKVLSHELAGNKSYVERFITEARMAAKVKHTHIITGIDVGQVEGMYYLVMEYFPGRPVNTIIYEKGRMALGQAVEIAVQIADALDHAHRSGLVHRDVKPENILLHDDGTAKLCDMGLAKLAGPESQGKGETVGTPLYISPELVQGRTDVDVRSDIYSLGATLYHMILGRPPHIGADSVSIMRMHMDVDVVPPAKRDDSVPEEISAIVAKMLRRKPEERYQTPADLLADLRAFRDKIGKSRPMKAEEQKPLAAEPRKPAPKLPAAKTPPAGATAEPKAQKTSAESPRRKPKTRRAKSSSAAMVLVLAALAAGLVIGAIALSGGGPAPDPKPGSGGDRKTRAPDDPDDPPVPPPVQPEQAQRAALDDALRFQARNPAAFQEIIARFEKAAAMTPATAVTAEAADLAAGVRKQLAGAERAEFDAACAASDAALAAGRNLHLALAPWTAFESKFRPPGAMLAGEAAARRKKVEEEISTLWLSEAKKAAGLASTGDFDGAVKAVEAALGPEGIADAACIAKVSGEDPEVFLEDLRKQRRDFAGEVGQNAGQRYKAFVDGLLAVLSQGKAPAGGRLGPYSRFAEAHRICKAAAEDARYGPKAREIGEWLAASALAESFLRGAGTGLEAWAARKRKVALENPAEEVTLESVSAGEGGLLVGIAGAAPVKAAEFLDRLGHSTLYDLAVDGLGGQKMNAAMHRGAALFVALSPPGSVPFASEKIDVHVSKAGAPLEPPLELAELYGAHAASAAAEEIQREFEALKKASEKAKDKGSAARAIEKWLAWLEKNQGQKFAADSEGFVRGEMKRLDRIANPPQPVKVPGLAVKADSFDPKTGKIEISYGFDERGAASDWAPRRFHFGSDNWADYAIEQFLGKSIDAKYQGTMQCSGGGMVMWKPRVVGDFVIEADMSAQSGRSHLLLLLATDSGGYSFSHDLDISGLADYARTNNIPIDPAAGTGIFTARLAWPPAFKGLKSDLAFKMAPGRWYALRIERKGQVITAEIGTRGRKPDKTFAASDSQFKEGRIGVCIMKSSLSLDNFAFSGSIDLRWVNAAESGRDDSGDMPGAAQ